MVEKIVGDGVGRWVKNVDVDGLAGGEIQDVAFGSKRLLFQLVNKYRVEDSMVCGDEDKIEGDTSQVYRILFDVLQEFADKRDRVFVYVFMTKNEKMQVWLEDETKGGSLPWDPGERRDGPDETLTYAHKTFVPGGDSS